MTSIPFAKSTVMQLIMVQCGFQHFGTNGWCWLTSQHQWLRKWFAKWSSVHQLQPCKMSQLQNVRPLGLSSMNEISVAISNYECWSWMQIRYCTFKVVCNKVLADRSSKIYYKFNPCRITVEHNGAMFCGVKDNLG